MSLHQEWGRRARRWLVGAGRTVVLLCVVATCAEPPAGVVKQDAEMAGLPGGPIISNSTDDCGEAQCVPVSGAYISHFTELGCKGLEHYYTEYDGGNGGVRRSWNGQGIAGTILRTETHKSYKVSNGHCYDAWPGGNQLSGFVRIYRGQLPVCAPTVSLSGPYEPTSPGTYTWYSPYSFPSTGVCAQPTSLSITWTRDGQQLSGCANNKYCSLYVTSGPSFTMGVTMTGAYGTSSASASASLDVVNNVKCGVGLSISGESRPPGAGNYTYTANASAGECGGPFSYTWTQYYHQTIGSVTPCGNVSSCTISFAPNSPFTWAVTATRTWRDGSTTTASSELLVYKPFEVTISGPTWLANNEYATWNAQVSGGLAPFGWQWYVDGTAVPDQFSLSRSFWGESWHSIRVVAGDGHNNTAQHEITVYVAPGSDCSYIIGCEQEVANSRVQETKPTRSRPPASIRSPQSSRRP